MSLPFNTLYLGEPDEVADILDGGDYTPEATMAELQAALVNAFRRIDKLESQIANMRKDLNE